MGMVLRNLLVFGRTNAPSDELCLTVDLTGASLPFSSAGACSFRGEAGASPAGAAAPVAGVGCRSRPGVQPAWLGSDSLRLVPAWCG